MFLLLESRKRTLKLSTSDSDGTRPGTKKRKGTTETDGDSTMDLSQHFLG